MVKSLDDIRKEDGINVRSLVRACSSSRHVDFHFTKSDDVALIFADDSSLDDGLVLYYNLREMKYRCYLFFNKKHENFLEIVERCSREPCRRLLIISNDDYSSEVEAEVVRFGEIDDTVAWLEQHA